MSLATRLLNDAGDWLYLNLPHDPVVFGFVAGVVVVLAWLVVDRVIPRGRK